MTSAILVLNSGSSSIKFSAFDAQRIPDRSDVLFDGAIDGIGHGARLTIRTGGGAVLIDEAFSDITDHVTALRRLLEWIEQFYSDHRLVAVGHRIVHGGMQYHEPMLIDTSLMVALKKLIPLAPLHQPHALKAVEALMMLHPSLPQIACFDTAFHRTESEVATAFALPRSLSAEGVRRYGFHGLSYEYIASVLPTLAGALADERVVVAHLGSGASMCAMRNRLSVATTMGFTALDGLPMSRRSGTIDPGVVLYLQQEKGMSAAAVSNLLYHESGLLGVSGISDDMRVLLASTDLRAKDAIDLFVYRIGREIGSLAAALGGLDVLVFTAGIGEHAAEIRRRVCEQAEWLGLSFDNVANQAGGPCITLPESRILGLVIPTDEDLVIARHTWKVIA